MKYCMCITNLVQFNNFKIITYVAPAKSLLLFSSIRILSTRDIVVPFEGNLRQSKENKQDFTQLIQLSSIYATGQN